MCCLDSRDLARLIKRLARIYLSIKNRRLLEIKEEGDVGEEEEKLSKIIKNDDIFLVMQRNSKSKVI